MKRRSLIQSLAGAPLAAALPQPAPAQEPARGASETPKIATAAADAAATGVQRFFSADEFAALKRICELMAPAEGDIPGATEAGTAEFLDFLIGASPEDRQKLYREGLDHLNAEAQRRFGRRFADLADGDAASILEPLGEAWTYGGPASAFAKFLEAAKLDAVDATRNSREWSLARAKTSRRAGGLGTYWYPIE
jgi:hypothetical protein